MECRDRAGRRLTLDDSQDRLLERLYGSPMAAPLVRIMISPVVSKAAGLLLSTRLSAAAVEPFRKKNGIDMADYEQRRFRSFNDFFTRRIRPGCRPIERDPDILASPCDCRLTVYPIGEDLQLRIKGVDYTLESLLRSADLAEQFRGGWAMVFRLTVTDYHRYCFPDSGRISECTRIPGVYHTVNPAAASRRGIYRENTREYALLDSDHFGRILQMEVGAAMVGRIVNLPGARRVERGEEKGRFEFGGSTILLLLQKDTVIPDADLLKNTEEDAETAVRMGEAIGRSFQRKETT